MYGYVKTYRPELKCREQDCYQAAYCGLCRAQGRCTGQCSRLTLSYDMTFFALFRMALTGEHPVSEKHACPTHPFRKRRMLRQGDALTHTAMASALLVFHKLRDDMADETGKRYARARILSPLVTPARRRADRMRVPVGTAPSGDTPDTNEAPLLTGSGLDARIEACMQSLSELEARRPASVDEPAQLFGELMADVLAYGLDGTRARLAREVGLRTGRWVYILDAADDYDEDVRRGRYNPFICLRGSREPLDEDCRRGILQSLDMETAAILAALDLIGPDDAPSPDVLGIIRNVLTEGMPRTARDILFPPAGKTDHKTRTKDTRT